MSFASRVNQKGRRSMAISVSARLIQRGLLAALLACSACSSSKDADDDDDESKAGSSASGTGGRSGSGGSTRAGTGAPMPPPVACGDKQCTAPMSLLSGLPFPGLPVAVACCVDEAEGTCGSAAAEGATCEPPAVPDERCPGVNLAQLGPIAGGLSGQQMMGCCTPNGDCGLDGAFFGRGCVENGEARAQLGAIPLIGTLLPNARRCDAPPETEEDAGI
jgi:hypothetical protein